MIYKFFLFLLVIVVSGCGAKIAPPVNDISNAKIAILKAKDSNAPLLSSTEYKRAESYLKQTKEFMDKEEFAMAKQTAEKAYIEAKLSDVKAQNAELQKKVDKLGGEINLIKKDFTMISE